ncbi:hypothetical protein CONLIGDRAFT_205965 [Coniochaeta ligniaria NRRL 30616]|uniref:BRCT domain-containing protein n=1 Tax=Coniochaeta ligniaria NRRL 30616 TaxID=1408157 RepID=A0A1J7JX80_9PEZI|nr:hypothetical protein CONLIGDRAFT_205965 [Coniochaeta ligniaria NRRL 30616]
MPQKRSEKQIFQDMNLAVACSLGGQWTDVNITRWVSRRGGVYNSEITEQTTHLICTVEEYKAKSLRVKQAAKLGQKQCKIVTLDWLEDCLFRDKKLPVKDYQLSAVLKNERAKELQDAKIAKGHELADRFVNTNLYHVYADGSNFFYEVTLTRDDTEAGWQGQKYILYLFESNAKPHLYRFAAKFYQKPRDSQPKFYRPSETPQSFWTEYDKFKAFFLKKTGIEWDERLVQISLDESLFQYKAPTGGKPVGYVPESGQRKPSSLPVAKGQVASASQVKTEPDEKDVQFAEVLKRLVAANSSTTTAENHKYQPLTNDQTIAVAMQVDMPEVVVKREIMHMPAETAKHESSRQEGAMAGSLMPEDSQQHNVKQEDKPTMPFPVASQAVLQNKQLDQDVGMDTSDDGISSPTLTSPYFTSAADTYVTMPLIHTEARPVTKHSMKRFMADEASCN